MMAGKNRCPGCDCRNVSGEIRVVASRRSCCKKCGTPNSPCAYVAIMECDNPWPLVTNNMPPGDPSSNCDSLQGFYWPGFPYGDEGLWMRANDGNPAGRNYAPAMTSPFIFLGKKCQDTLNSEGCVYASYHAPWPGGTPGGTELYDGCNIVPTYFRPEGDNPYSAEWSRGFPWKNPFSYVFGGVNDYVPFRFEAPIPKLVDAFNIFYTEDQDSARRGRCTWAKEVTPEWVLAHPGNGIWDRSCTAFCECDDNFNEIAWGPRETWTLDADAGAYSFMPNSSDMWDKIGRSPPVYNFVGETWSCEKRNPMRLSDPAMWPELKPEICIVASDWPQYYNPCNDDIDIACKCCERGGKPNGGIDVLITGCQFGSGAFTVPMNRIYDPGTVEFPLNELPLPAVPSEAPCGFFLGEKIVGLCSTHTDGTGPDGGTRYWSGMAFLYYCDGTDYIFRAWCHQVTADGVHVGWVEADVTYSTSCDCDGPILAFSFTSLPCCCTGPQTHCCERPIPATLNATVSAPGCPCLDGAQVPITYDGTVWTGSAANGGCTVSVTQGNQTLFGQPYCPIALSCNGSIVAAACAAMPGTLQCVPAFFHEASCVATDPCGCTGTITITVTITE